MASTIFITIDRHVTGFDLTTADTAIHADGWLVTVTDLDDPCGVHPRCEHAVTAEQRDSIVSEITAEYKAAGKPVTVIQPRTPATYYTPAMALRDYAPVPR